MSVITFAATSGTDTSEHVVKTTAATMVNGTTIFTAVGDVVIHGLSAKCITENDGTASTLQYGITATGLSQVTISAASASLASAAVGTIVSLDGTALSTALTVTANATALSQVSRGILFPEGVLKTIVGVGSTTGTWEHRILYSPMTPGAYVRAGA